MTDQQMQHQIEEAFERLDGALAPPLDAQDRVARRITVRRRRRRAGIVGTVALVAVVGVGAALTQGGGDEPRSDGIAVDRSTGPVSTLVMTRADGSTYAFDDVTVSCEPPKDYDTARPGHIYLWSPMAFENDKPAQPFVYFDGNVSKVEGDRTIPYPNDWMMDSDHYPMTLFIADSAGPDGNEVASSAGATTGTVRVLEASCDPTPVLRLAIDISLGTEEDGKDPITLVGALD